MMDIWDVLVVAPFDCMLTISDSNGATLFVGRKHNVPMDMRDMVVERLAPSHDYMEDYDYLWIEVL